MTQKSPDSPPLQSPSSVLTFMIADVRGYTRFTVEHGNAAAARLASRFAHLTREAVLARDGTVIELRGDEALAVFNSCRQALWAAVELQSRFALEGAADPALPLRVGIGIDAGEAIPVEGGYRGAALNLAARLCSLAGPAEVLASETVTTLARKLEGLDYQDRGSVELKGFADPVRIVEIVAAQATATDDDETAVDEKVAGPDLDQHLPLGAFLGALPIGMLVARQPEFEQIVKAVDVAVTGEGRTIMLAGEPGAGKTRLAQEATLSLRDRGCLIASGRCYEPE